MGKKRRREVTLTDDEDDERVPAGGAGAHAASSSSNGEAASGAGGMSAGSGRGGKPWKDASAGAPLAGDSGKYVHTWNEHRQNKDGGGAFKEGKWTPEEDATLLQAYDDYCITHEVTDEDRLAPVVEGVKGTEHQAVWLEVASSFKHRTVRAVLRRATRLLHPGNHKGKFSASERSLLRTLVAQHGRAWQTIGRIMNRLPTTVRGAFDNLHQRDTGQMGDWGASEEARLTQLLQRYGTRAPGGVGYTDVPWNVVAAKMRDRSALQCMKKWTDGLAARALGLTWDAAQDRALVDGLLADGGDTRDEVAWAAVLPGRPAAEVRRRFDALVKRLPQHASRSFEQCVHLLDRDLARDIEVTRGGRGRASSSASDTDSSGSSGNDSDSESSSDDRDAPRAPKARAVSVAINGAPSATAAAASAKARAPALPAVAHSEKGVRPPAAAAGARSSAAPAARKSGAAIPATAARARASRSTGSSSSSSSSGSSSSDSDFSSSGSGIAAARKPVGGKLAGPSAASSAASLPKATAAAIAGGADRAKGARAALPARHATAAAGPAMKKRRTGGSGSSSSSSSGSDSSSTSSRSASSGSSGSSSGSESS
jgi:hypothetical protein